MDIFLKGPQGCGKTRTAEMIIKNSGLHDSDVLYMENAPKTSNVRVLVETIRAARVRAVVFDGCTSAEVLIGLQAVKEYRIQIGADITAIYIQQGGTSIAEAAAFQELTADDLTNDQKNRIVEILRERPQTKPLTNEFRK